MGREGTESDVSHLHEHLLPERSTSFSFLAQTSPSNYSSTIDVDDRSDRNPEPRGSSPVSPLWSRSSSRNGSEYAAMAAATVAAAGAGVRVHRERSRRSENKRRLRNPIQKKSLVKRAAFSVTHHPLTFLKNVIWGVVLWPKWVWDSLKSQKKLTIMSLKAGFTAGLASILCVLELPTPYDGLTSIAIWAVVTIDLLSEGNIGLSLSKGVNRVAGTFSAGALAVILTQLGPDIPVSIYPYYVVFWVAFGGFVFRFLKGIPPLKDQWGYAFTVATIAFHILLIGTYQEPENAELPLVRFCMILLGFFLFSIVNLAVEPVYAGDTLHALVAKNFDTAADILSRCVTDYTNSRMLDHVPDILMGRSEDDKIHQSYHEIVMSDSDVDKLLNAVTWEPCHGLFFRGYPWHLYDDITDYLRYTLYDVIALDSCLRASIQAPKPLRDMFAQEMQVIAAEVSTVLRTLAGCMRKMCKFSSQDILCRAEEAALALQNTIYLHTPQLLGRTSLESPRNGSYVGRAPSAKVDPWSDPGTMQQSYIKTQSPDQFDQSFWNESESESRKTNGPDVGLSDTLELDRRHSAPVVIPYHQGDTGLDQQGYSNHDNFNQPPQAVGFSLGTEGSQLSRTQSESLERQLPEIAYEGEGLKAEEPNILAVIGGLRQQFEKGRLLLPVEPSIPAPSIKSSSLDWKESFMQRKSSLGHNFEGSLERISALSLVKFASLLIEIVAKMKFVVGSVHELSVTARFRSEEVEDDSPSGSF